VCIFLGEIIEIIEMNERGTTKIPSWLVDKALEKVSKIDNFMDILERTWTRLSQNTSNSKIDSLFNTQTHYLWKY